MAWEINQLNVDFHNNRAVVSLNQSGPPTAPNDYMNIMVNFGVADADQRKEVDTEQALKARAKQLLLDAANSL
jgi:hypothetical protein